MNKLRSKKAEGVVTYRGREGSVVWLLLALVMLLSYRPCSAEKRRFTLADDIQLVSFADTPIVFSSDRYYFLVDTQRGVLRSNRAESTLRVYRTEDVYRYVLAASRSHKPHPAWAVSLATFRNGPIINDIHWLPDSKAFAFLARSESGKNQLFLANIARKVVTAITPNDQDVTGFSIRDRGNFVYTVLSPAIRRKAMLESKAISFVGTGQSLNRMLFPENLYPSQQRLHDLSELWAVVDGHRFRVSDSSSGRPLPLHFFGQQALSLAPNGRMLLTAMSLETISPEWEALYPPAVPSSPYRIRAGHQDPEGFDGERNVSQYVLVNLLTNRVKPLVDAPLAHATGWWGLPRADWAPDGRSLVISNTFLPGSEGPPGDANRPCGVAVIRLPAMTTNCLEQLKPQQNNDYRYVANVRFANRNDARIVVDHLLNDYVSKESIEYLRAANGTWNLDSGTNLPSRDATSVEVFIKQGPNNPPILMAAVGTENVPVEIWDPNPRLRDVELGPVSVFKWRDKSGRDWIGGLYLPPRCVPGSRYPLVIQTHGFDEGAFSPTGSFPTANAAQELAGAGIAVLQVRDCPVRLTLEEGSCQIAGYTAAVQQLAAHGLIDPDKVGIIGFSRTCYYVLESLTSSALHFEAAAITDGVNEGYLQYMTFVDVDGNDAAHEAEAIIGAAPFGAGLQPWLARSPVFNMDKVTTPLQIVALGRSSVLAMWEPYAALRYLNRPVDLVVLPEGVHVLTNPQERMASQGGTVDWFSFWLKGVEDPDPAKLPQYVRWREMRDRQKSIREAEGEKVVGTLTDTPRSSADDEGVQAEAPDVSVPRPQSCPVLSYSSASYAGGVCVDKPMSLVALPLPIP